MNKEKEYHYKLNIFILIINKKKLKSSRYLEKNKIAIHKISLLIMFSFNQTSNQKNY